MKRKDWQDGLKIIFPVMLGYIPLGLACGMLLYDSGFSISAISLMSFIVFAGAAQFMAASIVVIGSTAPTIILMVFFLNIRHLLMSSSLSGFFKKSSIPFILLFGHTLADEAYAINYNQFKNHEWTHYQALATNVLATNVLAYLTWVVSTTIGGFIGSTLTIDITIMNYVLIAMFIALLINQLVSKLFVFVGLVAGLLSVGLMELLHHNIALVIAAILASLFGYLVDKTSDEQKVKGALH
ncbi:4-azaleucine resistance probable transporter AzlC [Carnobacterium iners]|uniref:4-azaleucine resistance probable transporter AzlC n=1 Tax=Carnobacterium iners TaxID=1073423 RepID=A0A1X7N5D6_9LACT|nr:AzlC family ABC transporter permease [Carnobacterium iners]SEK62810.1 4-azaleucine resistance probable transporter AzlC [Carnobacterium iners]SMH31687.1 4-azaleucine resistance probable transporter AzlC [Carnobacterium iners]